MSGGPLSDEDRLDWLILSKSENVGPTTFRTLIKRFHTAGNALRGGDEIGHDAFVLVREPATGAAHAGLHFVEHEEDAAIVAKLAQLHHQFLRRDVEAAFAEDEFHDYAGNLPGIDVGLEEFVHLRDGCGRGL